MANIMNIWTNRDCDESELSSAKIGILSFIANVVVAICATFNVSARSVDTNCSYIYEVPLSVPDAQLRYTPDGRQCPIVDLLTDAEIKVEDKSVQVVTITTGEKKGFKRLFLENTPRSIKVSLPGFSCDEIILYSDSMDGIEFGKQYEVLFASGIGGSHGFRKPNYNDVKITVSPSNLRHLFIKVDTKRIFPNIQTQTANTRVRCGLHRYSVEAEGYKPVDGRFWVTPSKPVTIKVTLKKTDSDVKSDTLSGYGSAAVEIAECNPPRKEASHNRPTTKRTRPSARGKISGNSKPDYKSTQKPTNGPVTAPDRKRELFENPFKPIDKKLESSNVSQKEPEPRLVEGGAIFIETFSPRDIPVIVMPKIAAWADVKRVRYIGDETPEEAKKKRYNSTSMSKFEVTGCRKGGDGRINVSAHCYIIDKYYNIYSMGMYYPIGTTEKDVLATTVFVFHHWGEYYGNIKHNGLSDFYYHSQGGSHRYYGEESGTVYDIPGLIRGIVLSDDDLYFHKYEIKDYWAIVENYFSQKTVSW